MAGKARSKPKKSQTPDKLMAAISDGELAPVYYFYAGDGAWGSNKGQSAFNDYLLDIALEAIRKAVVDGNTKDFNYNVFVASDSGLAPAIEVASTYPMMRPKRLVIVKDANEARADDWKSALNYLADPSPQTCLVFIGEKFPTQNKGGAAAKQAVLENAVCVRFAPFTKPKDVQPYLQAELRRRKKKIDRQAETLLLDLIGYDFAEILLALEKLDLYTDERDMITVRDIEQCIAKTRMEMVWGLQDALAERRVGRALAALGSLMHNAKTEDEIFLMGSLIRFYNDLIGIRLLLDDGMPARSVVQELGGNQWAMGKKVDQAKLLPLVYLSKTLTSLQQCDQALRSSPVPNSSLFERFVMQVCGKGSSR